MINLHIRNGNLGDLVSPPTLYFQFPSAVELVNLFDPPRTSDITIFGGGGLFYCEKAVEVWLEASQGKAISWGIGQNRHDTVESLYPPYIEKFAVQGIRDWGTGYPWVPCASCMHSAFDKQYDVQYDYVVYSHREVPLNIENFPQMTNSCDNLEDVINFLGSSKCILTNTYHGAYWGTLLGRQVLIVNPFSSRFYYYKHQPKIVSLEDWRTDGIPVYSEALTECRAANKAYYEKLMNMEFLWVKQ
jgi:hypothetical protein